MTIPRIHIYAGKDSDGIDLSAKQAGQIIVIFALMLTTLIGLVGFAIDVTYAWRNGMQIQRAADAAAMAGVVYLPGDLGTGQTRAYAIAQSNGYVTGGGTIVTANKAPTDDRKMDVTISAPVPTFFVRLFGINNWTISKTARAAYLLPVPMGSPLNYMGVGCLVRSGVTPAPGCNTAGTGESGVTDVGTTADGGNSLDSLGAWGAVITKGGNQENGDAYSPANNTPTTTWPVNVTSNVLYDPDGYYYTAVLPVGGDIKIFDPGFCENKANGPNYYGTGDHWIGAVGGTYNAVSTYYRVLNTHDQPMNTGAWDTSGGVNWDYTFVNKKTTDGGAHGTGACDVTHNKWWTLASGLGPGTYEVQVSTTNPTDATSNTTVNAENTFAIMVPIGGTVYGYDRMAVYNNLSGNGVLQQFYLAKVSKDAGAGKTLTIDLFDVGDSTAGSIQILSPSDGTRNPAHPVSVPFNYITYSYNSSGIRVRTGNCRAYSGSVGSDACAGNGVSSIQVAKSGNNPGSSFNNTWIEITIPLSSNSSTGYGQQGPNSLWQGGWWQVQYNVTAGNDTTTWSVNVNGNPVRLVPYP